MLIYIIIFIHLKSSLYIGLFRAAYNFKHIFTILFVNFTVSEKYILEDSFLAVCPCVHVCVSTGPVEASVLRPPGAA